MQRQDRRANPTAFVITVDVRAFSVGADPGTESSGKGMANGQTCVSPSCQRGKQFRLLAASTALKNSALYWSAMAGKKPDEIERLCRPQIANHLCMS